MIKKAGISQLLLVCINLVSLGLIISGLGIGTAKEKANADVKSNIEWKQTACRVAGIKNFKANNTSEPTELYTYLGPAEWTAEYTIGSKNIKEVWKASEYKDSILVQESNGPASLYRKEDISVWTINNKDTCKTASSDFNAGSARGSSNDELRFSFNGSYSAIIDQKISNYDALDTTSSARIFSIPQGWNVTMEY